MQRQKAESSDFFLSMAAKCWDALPFELPPMDPGEGLGPPAIRTGVFGCKRWAILPPPAHVILASHAQPLPRSLEAFHFLVCILCLFFFLQAPTCAGFDGCAAVSQLLVDSPGSVTCPQVPCTTQNCCTRMHFVAFCLLGRI